MVNVRRPAPFVRVSYDCDVEVLKYLITYRWGLRPPRVLISVTGGAKDFHLPPQLDKMLKVGLLRAAQASNAWFITGGSNSGKDVRMVGWLDGWMVGVYSRVVLSVVTSRGAGNSSSGH